MSNFYNSRSYFYDTLLCSYTHRVHTLNATKNVRQRTVLTMGCELRAAFLCSRVSFVTDGGCLACRYDLTDELRTQTDTRQLELWSQEDIVLDP